MAFIRKDAKKDFKKRKMKRMPKKKAMRVNIAEINYKNLRFLQQFVSDRGKLLPRRITNVSARSQRAIAAAVRQARMLSYLPFTGNQVMRDTPRPPRSDYASDSAR